MCASCSFTTNYWRRWAAGRQATKRPAKAGPKKIRKQKCESGDNAAITQTKNKINKKSEMIISHLETF